MGLLVNGMVELIRRNGGNLVSRTRVERLHRDNGMFQLSCRSGAAGQFELTARRVVLACGRSGAAWIADTLSGVGIQSEPGFFDIGIRLEGPRESFESFVTQYGQDAKIKYSTSPYPVRTFCVCAGGTLARVTYNGTEYAEGVFGESLTKWGNLAIQCRVPVPAGARCDRMAMGVARASTAKSQIVAQDLVSFWRDASPTIGRGATIRADVLSVRDRLPSGILTSVLDGLDRLFALAPEILRGETTVVGPAVNHYWNVYTANSDFMTPVHSLYLVGDALGRFRGILQAAWSGIVCARSIIASVDCRAEDDRRWYDWMAGSGFNVAGPAEARRLVALR